MPKVTLDLPKGSELEAAARRYVVAKFAVQGTKLMRLKDVKITAEYEVVEARP